MSHRFALPRTGLLHTLHATTTVNQPCRCRMAHVCQQTNHNSSLPLRNDRQHALTRSCSQQKHHRNQTPMHSQPAHTHTHTDLEGMPMEMEWVRVTVEIAQQDADTVPRLNEQRPANGK